MVKAEAIIEERGSKIERDAVLARLLALNAERYAEEAAKLGGKRRGRPARTSQPGETGGDLSERMGLGL